MGRVEILAIQYNRITPTIQCNNNTYLAGPGALGIEIFLVDEVGRVDGVREPFLRVVVHRYVFVVPPFHPMMLHVLCSIQYVVGMHARTKE